jgi:hypothetical protein
MTAGNSSQVGNIRIERVSCVKLTPEKYAELVHILSRVAPVPIRLGKGRQPSHVGSFGRLAKMFGISQARVSQIARDVHTGRANPERAYGLRAMRLEPKRPNTHGGAVQSYVEGVSIPSPGPGLPAIVAHVRTNPGSTMLEFLTSGAWHR